MHSGCEFCKILHKNTEAILFQDNQFFAFHDIDKASAREHVLVCTKEHIETALDVTNPDVLFEMEKVGKKVLDSLCATKSLGKNHRFGFHLPPYNSIDHIHLHCFTLPFDSIIKDKIVYGKMLTSVEDVRKKIDKRPKL